MLFLVFSNLEQFLSISLIFSDTEILENGPAVLWNAPQSVLCLDCGCAFLVGKLSKDVPLAGSLLAAGGEPRGPRRSCSWGW